MRNPFTEVQKYNHRQLVRDLRGDDADIRIFALRTIIKLERKNLNLQKDTTAIADMTRVIQELMPSWPEELRFYGTRAVERLAELDAQARQAAEPLADEEGFDPAQLDSPDARVVVAALKKVEASGEKAALPKITEMLGRADDPQILGALLGTLAVLGEADALMAVKRLCNHANGRVRAQCVDAIEKLSKEPAITEQMVEPFLADRDGLVRARAIRCLGPTGFARVAKAVEASVSSPQVPDRAALAEALATIKADDATVFLKKLSDDPDETVRLKLLESLARSDHPQKLLIAQKLKKDASAQVRKVAKEAVGQYETKRLLSMGGFDMQPPPGVKNMQSLEEIAAQEELDPINPEHLKHRDPAVKLQCLHKIRARAYAEAHANVLALLGTSENDEILATVLSCLTVIGSNKDVESVMHFLVHQAPAVRAAAAEAVEQLGGKTQVIFLLLPMLHDKDITVRGVAARAMLEHPFEDLLAHIKAMAAQKAVGIRVRLMQLLAHYSGPVSQEILSRAALDPAPQVRGALVQQDLPFEPWGDALLQTLANDPVEAIKNAARSALAGREKRRQTGREGVAPPPLEKLLEVARTTLDEATQHGKAQEEARLAAAAAAEAAAGSALPGALGKLSQDMEAAHQLDMLKGNRDMLLEAMGKKLYAMIKRKLASHRAYEKTFYVIEKYQHLSKSGKLKEEAAGGFWGKLKDMAGVNREEEDAAKLQDTLRKHYIELGRIAMELSYKENLIYPELNMEYIEIENVEKRIGGR